MAHQPHIHLNPHMNEENIPLPYNYDIEKYHMGYQLEAVCNQEGISYLSIVYYNALSEYNDNSNR